MKDMHQTVRLARGRHAGPHGGTCVMELASLLAGEPFSDRPASACPVIGGVLRAYNDADDDELGVQAVKALGRLDDRAHAELEELVRELLRLGRPVTVDARALPGEPG